MAVRNKFEKSIQDSLKKKKVKFDYEKDKFNYTIEGTYLADFSITKKDGTKFYIETKGHFDYAARRKMVAVLKANPDADIRFIFYNAKSKTAKNSLMTYADWAEKYNCQWSHKELPDEWLDQ